MLEIKDDKAISKILQNFLDILFFQAEWSLKCFRPVGVPKFRSIFFSVWFEGLKITYTSEYKK